MTVKEIIDIAKSGAVYDFNSATEMGYMLTDKGRVLTKSKFYIGDEIIAITDTTVGDFKHTTHISKGGKLVVTCIIKAYGNDPTYYINEGAGFEYLHDSNAFTRWEFKPESTVEYLMVYHNRITMRKEDKNVILYKNKNVIIVEGGEYELYDLKDLKSLIHAFYIAGYKIYN